MYNCYNLILNQQMQATKIPKYLKQKLSEETKNNNFQINIARVKEATERTNRKIMKLKAKTDQLIKNKGNPQRLLHIGGYMNQQIQAYIISRNLVVQPLQTFDPDNMTYEQLLQLQQKIGKVSKGLNQQDINSLIKEQNRIQQQCCICQSILQISEIIIVLNCKHIYHQQCILNWFKDQNVCPLCKQPAVKN